MTAIPLRSSGLRYQWKALSDQAALRIGAEYTGRRLFCIWFLQLSYDGNLLWSSFKG